jgi:hypothetical protein
MPIVLRNASLDHRWISAVVKPEKLYSHGLFVFPSRQENRIGGGSGENPSASLLEA